VQHKEHVLQALDAVGRQEPQTAVEARPGIFIRADVIVETIIGRVLYEQAVDEVDAHDMLDPHWTPEAGYGHALAILARLPESA
jgi:hypothetical protein